MALAFLTIGRRRRGRRRCDIIFVPISGRSARRVRFTQCISRPYRVPGPLVVRCNPCSPPRHPSVRLCSLMVSRRRSRQFIVVRSVYLSVCLKRRDGPSRLEADCCCPRGRGRCGYCGAARSTGPFLLIRAHTNCSSSDQSVLARVRHSSVFPTSCLLQVAAIPKPHCHEFPCPPCTRYVHYVMHLDATTEGQRLAVLARWCKTWC